MSTSMSGSPRAVKSVQRGTATITCAAGVGSQTVTISAVDTNKTRVRCESTADTTAVTSARSTLTNATTITLNVSHSQAMTGIVVLNWEAEESF